MPIVGLLSAAGILKGVILILLTAGVLSESSDAYAVLNAVGDSLFYFLPIFIAKTSAEKFGANPYIAMVTAGVLLYPSLVSLMSDKPSLDFFGLPIKSAVYSSSVIPVILASALLAALEKILGKYLPEVIKSFAVPMLSIIIVSMAALFVFGPFGAVVGDLLAEGYNIIYNLSPVAAGLILGATIQPMVLIGVHWSFIIVAMNNITVNGSDTILALIAPPIFAHAGAALAVMIKAKGESGEVKKFRSACIPGIISSILGVTEPIMFGVNLPRKKPMIAVCVGSGIGGAIAGFCGVQAHTFAFPSLAALPIYFGEGFGLFIAANIATFAVSFVMSLVMKYDTTVGEKAV